MIPASQNHLADYVEYARVPSLVDRESLDFDDVFPIILKYEEYVVVEVSYMNLVNEPASYVAELDARGFGLVKVPLSLVTRLMDEAEYENLCELRDADARLLSYAR